MTSPLENETDTINHSMYYKDDSFKHMLNCTSIEIGILNLNCRSLRSIFDQLKIFLADIDYRSQITCITLQETWFKDEVDLDYYTLPGYTLLSDCYRISAHGGVAIYVHNDFSFKRLDIYNTSAVYENISIELWRNNKIGTKYLISSIYRPPRNLVESLTTFINEFSDYLNHVEQIYRKAYICGDTNINLLSIHENIHYNTFYENVTMHGFMPQITLPTRLSDTCDTLIDNIFTNNFERSHTNCVLTRKMSDHQMTCCFLSKNNNCTNRVGNSFVEVEKINDVTLRNLQTELIETIFMKS